MTTPETPGDPDGQPDGSTEEVLPSAGPASRSGVNWRNRRVLIGRGAAAIVAVVVIVAAVMLTGGGPGSPSSSLALVPDDAAATVMLDMADIRSRQADFPGDYDDFIKTLGEEDAIKFHRQVRPGDRLGKTPSGRKGRQHTRQRGRL